LSASIRCSGLQCDYLYSVSDQTVSGTPPSAFRPSRCSSIVGPKVRLGIALQPALPLQEPADALRNRAGQLGELGTVRRLHPTESEYAIGALNMNPIEKQSVEVGPPQWEEPSRRIRKEPRRSWRLGVLARQ